MAAPQVSSRTALVTGATGFLGSHVVRALVDAGWRVLALQRGEADTTLLEGTPVTAVEADVCHTILPPCTKSCKPQKLCPGSCESLKTS